MFISLELSSCEEASDFYLNVFVEMIVSCTSDKIVSMNLDIDRGVLDFEELKSILTYGFDSLQELSISQNYTTNTHSDKENYEQFLSFLKELKLMKFKFIDYQSRFVNLITMDDIFEIMPDNAAYEFKLGYDPSVIFFS